MASNGHEDEGSVVRKRRKTEDSKEKDIGLNQLLQILPAYEVSRRIFDCLDLLDKLSARLVCQRWNDLVVGSLKFSPLLYDDDADEGSVPEVLNLGFKGVAIEVLTVSQFEKFKYPADGFGFSKIKKLRLIPRLVSRSGIEAKMVGISGDNLAELLKNYPDIESLYLHSNALGAVQLPSAFQSVKLNSLKQLSISTFNGDGHGFEVSADILKNVFPSLKSVHLRFINDEDNLIHIPLHYKDSYQFLVNHASTLDNISLHHNNCYDETLLESFELDFDHSMPQTEYRDLLEKIDNVKVSSLSFELTCYEGRSRFQFGIRLLKAQSTLTTLQIHNLGHMNIAVWHILPEVISRCADTLRDVSIRGCICSGVESFEQFSCTCLKNCSHLTLLEIDPCGLKIFEIEDLPRQIRSLSLGQMLTEEQIDFVVNNLQDLRKLNLAQLMAAVTQMHSIVPKVSFEIFKQVAKLPCLTHLTLAERTSSFKMIRWSISRTPGIEADPPDGRKLILLKIDQNLFNWNLL